MSTSYIPAKDSLFGTWLTNFSTLLTAAPTTYGLIAGDAVIVHAQQTAFNAALALATAPGTRTPVTVAAKDQARVDAEFVVRPYATQISRNPAVDNGDKVDIGVSVPPTGRTPIPSPTTAPAIILESAVPGLLNLQFRDSTTPLVKAKPFGVIGIELWAAFGTVPAVSPDATAYRGGFTKTPLQLDTAGNAGKVVTIFARWFNRSGVAGQAAVGPWSAQFVTNAI